MRADDLQRWRRDPVAFISEVLRDPETGQPFHLYPEEESFIRLGFTVTRSGRLPFAELLYSAPKKSGKTALAAMLVIYVIVVLAGNYGEGYCAANDFEQSASRVFQAITRIIQASLLLKNSAAFTNNKITFKATGATISAIASEYAGAAGANPNITVFDELWGYVRESSQRLWDEMVPVPTRKVSIRLTVTYAGFTGESALLESLYKRAIGGEQIGPDLYRAGGMLAYWTHECHAPWQTGRWLAQMREQHRPNAYLRQIENRWVSSEDAFVPMEWWDSCVDADAHALLADPTLPVWVGVDASTKRDSTAIVVCTLDRGLTPSPGDEVLGIKGRPTRVRLVWHRIFQPSPRDPLDFEATIERTLLDMRRRFYLKEVRYDPYQLVAVAQRLLLQGVPMVEFPQSVPNLTESSTNLYELIKARNLVVYADDEMRLSINRAVALETSRGWRIAKEKQSHKIDVVVALALAALGAVQQGQSYQKFEYTPASSLAAARASLLPSRAYSSDGQLRIVNGEWKGAEFRELADDDGDSRPRGGGRFRYSGRGTW